MKELTAEAEEIGSKLLITMQEEGLEKVEDSRGSVGISTRTTKAYSDSITKHINKIKAMAETKGEVVYTSKDVLTARLAEVEEDE